MGGFRNLRLVMVICTRAGIPVETNNRKHSSVVIFKDSGGGGLTASFSLRNPDTFLGLSLGCAPMEVGSSRP